LIENLSLILRDVASIVYLSPKPKLDYLKLIVKPRSYSKVNFFFMNKNDLL